MATDSQFLFVYGTLMGSAVSEYGRPPAAAPDGLGSMRRILP